MSGVSGVGNSYANAYGSFTTTPVKKAAEAAETKENTQAGAVYEPSKAGKAAASSVDRSAIVAQLKEDMAQRKQQMTDLVKQMMSQQGATLGKADDMWKFLASGNFKVDAATRAQAQADIAEDGYWGVKQTSQRIFDFAMALTGGDGAQMEKMRTAFEKGFKMATGSWGRDLPDISHRTYDATEKLFDDYAASLKSQA